MMATNPSTSALPAAMPKGLSTRALPKRLKAGSANPSRRRQASPSRPWDDLAGRAVALSPTIPAAFDEPLAPHHRVIGRWLAKRGGADQIVTRGEARRFITDGFDRAVQDAVSGIDIAEMRVLVLSGSEEGLPPAIAIICDSIGEIDLGWIGKTNVLANTLRGSVAPVGWRAAAYKALTEKLGFALPVLGYEDFLEELSIYYWDGATDDETARQHIAAYNGESDDADITLPSQIAALRPDYMLEKPAPLKDMPRPLRARLKRLDEAYKALKAISDEESAWRCDYDQVSDYLPHYMDASPLPSLTIVPMDIFGQHIDEVMRIGMETGFLDIIGLTLIEDADDVERWHASLSLGAEFFAAVEDLLASDPTKDRRR